MVEGPAPEELAARLAELEQQRADGSISEIGFNLRRNLLITRSEQLARRRVSAGHAVSPPPSAPPQRRRIRGGWLLSAEPSPPVAAQPQRAPISSPQPQSLPASSPQPQSIPASSPQPQSVPVSSPYQEFARPLPFDDNGAALHELYFDNPPAGEESSSTSPLPQPSPATPSPQQSATASPTVQESPPATPPPQRRAPAPPQALEQPGVAPPASRRQSRNDPVTAPQLDPMPVTPRWSPPDETVPRAGQLPVAATSAPVPERVGRPPQHRGRKAAAWAAAVAVVAGVALVGYRVATGPASDPSTAARATATPAGTASASQPPSTGIGTAIGQTQITSDGGRITLVAYDSNLLSIAGAAPATATGEAFAAVELKVCAGSAAPTSVTPYDFVLVEPGGALVDTLSGIGEGQQPALAMAEVPPGQCVSGWLSFEVTSAPASFTDSADGLSWVVS